MKGCNTVRNRSIQFVQTLQQQGYERLPLSQAKQVFSQTLGIYDRTSLKAYFGTQAGIVRHTVERFARYQSGVSGLKTIELSQRIAHQAGYLENLGLITYELVGKTWFAVLKPAILVPTLMKSDESMRNFSLSTIIEDSKGKGSEGKPCGVPSCVEAEERTLDDVYTVTTNKQQQHRVRERNLEPCIQNCTQISIPDMLQGILPQDIKLLQKIKEGS